MNKAQVKGTVLIVDDTVTIIDMVKTALVNDNFKILAATTGAKGIVSAEKGNPDLILLDIMMPETDGYETIIELKQNEKTAHIPVMFMSALTETFDKVKAFNLGAVDYVTKPLNLEELLARVNTQVSLHQMQEKLRNTNIWLENEVAERTKELKQSHEKYRTVANFAHDWEYWTLPDGSIEYMSPSCVNVTGYAAHEFINNPSLIYDIIHKNDLDIWNNHLNNETNPVSSSEEISFRIVTKQGDEKWISHVCNNVYTTNGEYNGIRVSNRDITAIKEAEILLLQKNYELQAAEEELRAGNEALKEYVQKLAESEKTLIEKNTELNTAQFELKAANDGLTEMIRQVRDNEERYRNLQENMPSGVVVYKPVNNGQNFEIIGFNRSAEVISGISRERAIGKTICSLIPNFEQSVTFKNLKEVYKTGKTIKANAQKVYDPKNEAYTNNQFYKLPTGEIVAIFDDVTDRILAEQKLIQSEKRFRALAENSPGVIYLCMNDSKYSMLYLNDKVEELTGYKKEDFLLGNLSFVDLYDAGYEDNIRNTVDKALKERTPFSLTYRIKTKQGELKWIEEYGIGVYENNALQFIEGTLIDVNERRSNEIINEAKFRISEYAANNNSKQLLTKILDEAEQLTQSQIGFYHFYNEETGNIALHAWSTNTKQNMCKADENSMHYHIDKAGVWVDCIRERQPVIHNSYADLKHKKGLPDGHATVVREAVVPVFRNNKIVAILGIGNKESVYNKQDVDIIGKLADIAFDVVLRKKAEEGLIENEKQLQLVFDNSPAIMMLIDPELRILKANKAALELVGKNYEQIHYYKSGDAFNCIYTNPAENGCGGSGNCRFCGIRSTIEHTITTGEAVNKNEAEFSFKKNGRVNKIDVYVSSTIATQNPDTYLVIIDDITQQKKAQREIINERNRSKNILIGTNAGTWEWNVQTSNIVLNDRWADIIGYKLEELTPNIETWIKSVHPDDIEKANTLLKKHFTGEIDYYDCEFRQIHKNGHSVWVYARGKVIEWTNDNKPLIMSGTHIDITAQKQVQQRILQAVISTEEAERKRVAQELHDGLGPVLSTVKLFTESYIKTDNKAFKATIENQLLDSIDEALLQVSTISNNLSPHVLNDFGLKAALERFIERIKKLSKTEYLFKYSVEMTLTQEIETTVYRVATELINNSLKYARATVISVNVFENQKLICLEYSDNGVGFDFKKVKDSKKGMGLFNIVNRVQSLNGELHFNENIENGVLYSIKIPNE